MSISGCRFGDDSRKESHAIPYKFPQSMLDYGSITSKMLFRFRSNKTFGQVTRIYNKKNIGDDVEEEDDVLFDINLYLKRGGLPSALAGSTAMFLLKECWFKQTL
jgi:hypothetical protein